MQQLQLQHIHKLIQLLKQLNILQDTGYIMVEEVILIHQEIQQILHINL